MTVNVNELELQAKELEARVEKAKSALSAMETNVANQIVGNRSTSVESQALVRFGCSSVKELLSVNTCAPQFANVPNELKAHVVALKRDFDVVRFMQQIFQGEPRDSGEMEKGGEIARVKGMFDSAYGRMFDLKGRIKAFGSTVSTAGDEWVPTAISSNYIEEYLVLGELPGLFMRQPMSSNPMEMPHQYGSTKARRATEGAAATSTNFNTGKITLNALKSVEYYDLPEELNEDSAPSIIAAARAEVIRAQQRAEEAALLNGDTTGTHMDSDTALLGADVAEKFWNGFRKRALANSTYGSSSFTGGAITDAKLKTLKKLMGKFGINPRELILIVGPSGYDQLTGLDEVSTVDKFGPMATILRGALAAWRGIPIVVSEYVREDLNASGVYDGTTTTMTCCYFVNTTRFMFGQRRPIRVRVSIDPRAEYDRTQLVSYQRVAFNGFTQSATERSCVLGYNILS